MRLIDADELRKDIVERGTQLSGCYSAGIARYMDRMLAHVLAAFDNAPTIDQVRHGRWIITQTPTNEYCNCSVCGTQVMSDEAWNYCPKCGAKMDEEVEA